MSVPFTLNEKAIKGIVAQAEAHAPALVAAINAEVTDGYTIAAPAQILDFLPLPAQLTSFPILAVGDGPIQIVDDLVTSVDSVPMLAIEAILQNADPRALAWGMRRYLQLIMRIVNEDRTLGGAVWTTRFKGVEPGGLAGPRDPEREVGYLLWNYVLVEVPRTEV